MTAQHAPHTPLWRKVLSLPQTRLGWWAVVLIAGTAALVWVLFALSVLIVATTAF
jgi:hypothetical protein